MTSHSHTQTASAAQPLEHQSIEEHQLALLSHPLLPYVLRAINDVNGELSDYTPPPAVWQDTEADPEVTQFLLQYLKLIEAQNAAANKLQSQAVLYCSRAAEERIQSAKTDSVSEADSDLDSPVESASAHGASISHKRTRSQSSLDDNNARSQRTRTGSIDAGNQSETADGAKSISSSGKGASPRLAAKSEAESMAAGQMNSHAAGPVQGKPDQAMMYPQHQWMRHPSQTGPVQPPMDAMRQPMGPMQGAGFNYMPQNSSFYPRGQGFMPMAPADPQMMRQRQMYPGAAPPMQGNMGNMYDPSAQRSPSSQQSGQSAPPNYVATGYPSAGYPPAGPELMRYGYMGAPNHSAASNVAMQRQVPLMNQMPSGIAVPQAGMPNPNGSVSQMMQSQARMQAAQMQQAAAMQAQMQMQSGSQAQQGRPGSQTRLPDGNSSNY